MDWPLLGPLSPVERSQLLASAKPRRFAREEIVCHEGDPSDSFHLIRSGRVAVRVSSPAGEVVTLNVLSAGDYFGELSLLRDRPSRHRTATLIALEDVETLSLSAAAFHALCERYPKVERVVVAFLARRVEELSYRLLEALYVSVDRRVYRRLVELARIYGDSSKTVAIPLRQEHVADLAGATRPTVNQVLQKLSSQGIVELHRGRIDVVDLPALRRRAASVLL